MLTLTILERRFREKIDIAGQGRMGIDRPLVGESPRFPSPIIVLSQGVVGLTQKQVQRRERWWISRKTRPGFRSENDESTTITRCTLMQEHGPTSARPGRRQPRPVVGVACCVHGSAHARTHRSASATVAAGQQDGRRGYGRSFFPGGESRRPFQQQTAGGRRRRH